MSVDERNDMSVNREYGDKSVDIWDVCGWKRCLLKEISVGEKDKYGWSRWIWEVYRKWGRKIM